LFDRKPGAEAVKTVVGPQNSENEIGLPDDDDDGDDGDLVPISRNSVPVEKFLDKFLFETKISN
jgi:hypothetical protein